MADNHGDHVTGSAATHTDTIARPTDAEESIRAWLLDYAWLGTAEQQEAEVDCIMSQDGWRHLTGRADHMMSMRSGENSVEADRDMAEGMALSSLYECHDGPHLPTCPRSQEPTASESPAGTKEVC